MVIFEKSCTFIEEIKRIYNVQKDRSYTPIGYVLYPRSLSRHRAKKKYLDPKSWHNQFFTQVTSRIDEGIFQVLFPEGKKSGRPVAPIRVLAAMSVLKEGFGCSDGDLFERCEYDMLTRRALACFAR